LAAASSRYFRANYAVILFQPLSFHMKMAVRRPPPIAAEAFAIRAKQHLQRVLFWISCRTEGHCVSGVRRKERHRRGWLQVAAI
jgi:hypothetical protein